MDPITKWFGEIFGGQKQTTQPKPKPQSQNLVGKLQTNQKTTQSQINSIK